MAGTVLVTGASGGIGRATAAAFSAAGWNVAATMRRGADDPSIRGLAGVEVLPLDVTSADSVAAALDATLTRFGRIDVVVNNAGFAVDGPFENMDDEVIRRQFDTNVFGLMRVTRGVIPVFRRQGSGTLVQVSSMAGRLTFPLYSVYHASKWAVEGFSESLAYELRPFGIRVRIIEPGAIRTDFYGRSRAQVPSAAGDGYAELVARWEAVSIARGMTGADPALVAATILRAATDRGGRLRYPVASPAPLLLSLRRWLPERWWMALVRRRYGIA